MKVDRHRNLVMGLRALALCIVMQVIAGNGNVRAAEPADAAAYQGCYRLTLSPFVPEVNEVNLPIVTPPSAIELTGTIGASGRLGIPSPGATQDFMVTPALGAAPSVHVISLWNVLPNDSLFIVWTMPRWYSGVRMTLKRNGSSLLGVAEAFFDAGSADDPPKAANVRAERVPCNSRIHPDAAMNGFSAHPTLAALLGAGTTDSDKKFRWGMTATDAKQIFLSTVWQKTDFPSLLEFDMKEGSCGFRVALQGEIETQVIDLLRIDQRDGDAIECRELLLENARVLHGQPSMSKWESTWTLNQRSREVSAGPAYMSVWDSAAACIVVTWYEWQKVLRSSLKMSAGRCKPASYTPEYLDFYEIRNPMPIVN